MTGTQTSEKERKNKRYSAWENENTGCGQGRAGLKTENSAEWNEKETNGHQRNDH